MFSDVVRRVCFLLAGRVRRRLPFVVAAAVVLAVPASGTASTADLAWHGGEILTSSNVTAIYWGRSWGNSSFVGDKITGLDSFYRGLDGSRYFATNTEYTGSNGQVGNSVYYTGHVIDTSKGPHHVPKLSAVLAEVSKMIVNPVANGYYPVYLDLPRGHAGYCATHSFGTINGVTVQFAFFFNLDGDAGCNPGDTSGLHSPGLAALANTSGNQISATVTNPRGGGWWDSGGAENSGKCAWTFNGLETLSNGSQFLIQGNYSNAAAAGGTGYDGAGCINGN